MRLYEYLKSLMRNMHPTASGQQQQWVWMILES